MKKPYIYEILIICPIGIQNVVNNDAGGWDTLGGQFTFTGELTSNPRGVATKVWANTRCNINELFEMQQTTLKRAGVKAWVKSTRNDTSELDLLFDGMLNVTIGLYNANDVLDSEGLRRANLG